MLKECYYFDQKDYTRQDYLELARYFDRMIEYRDGCKGSYNGEKRIEEIRKIDTQRLSENTKMLLARCIRIHRAEQLFELPNLQELRELPTDNLSFLEGKERMKLRAEDFYRNLRLLNTAIQEAVEKGDLPKEYVFEIRCIGGFAMSYWNVREEGITEDMDSLQEIDDAVRKIIQRIAANEGLPVDWINDMMLWYYNPKDFHWQPVDWFFGRNYRLRIFVCSKEDLLKNKMSMAESYLEGRNFQERNMERDYQDVLSLLRSLNIGFGTNPAMIQVKLANMGIAIKDYPKLYQEIITNGAACEPEDFLLLGCINRVDQGKMSFEEFKTVLTTDFGYTLENIREYYGIYLSEFPHFRAWMEEKTGQE